MARLTPDVIAAPAADKPTASTPGTKRRGRGRNSPPEEFDYQAEYRYQCLHSLIIIPAWHPVGLAELSE